MLGFYIQGLKYYIVFLYLILALFSCVEKFVSSKSICDPNMSLLFCSEMQK